MPSLERTELGGCRLIRKIGAGAMGEVYLAEQVHLGNRLVAVKVVQVLHDPSLPDESIAGAERHFIREARLLGQLAHPNILPVYHSGIEAGYLFLVMQYAPDGSLADAINGKGPHRLELPASLPFVIDVIGQVASALQYTHEHGVVHADVKPANVLAQVEPDGQWHVLLADFGIAHNRDTAASRNEIAGTVAYMAPEQFYGQVSPASDQYTLAVMAFQLLTGRTPFAGGFVEVAQAHAREKPPALRTFNPTVPAAAEAVIARALAKRPADRYPSVLAFAEALRAAFVDASTLLDARTRGVAAALLLPGGPGAGRGGAMPRASRAAARNELAPAAIADSEAPTDPATHHYAAGYYAAGYYAAEPPATTRSHRTTRRTVTGLAVVALLLVAVVAAIGLRSHIGVSQASSMSGAGANTGQASGSGGGSSGKGSGSPSAPPTVVTTTASPTPQATPSPQATQTPTPTATVTATPAPTVTATPAPTATPGLRPTPKGSPTPKPPKATASPPPTTASVPATRPSTSPSKGQASPAPPVDVSPAS